MADLRIPPAQVPALARAQPTPRVDAIRQAQRAFFQTAALDQPAPAAPAPTQTGASDRPATPQRLPRPGSLLDIKV